MSNKIIFLLNNYAKKPYIIFGILYILFANTVIFPQFGKTYMHRITISEIPDLQFGISKDFMFTTLQKLQKAGRKKYINFEIFIDGSYAIIYGITYVFLFLYILKIKNKVNIYGFLVLFPIFLSISDIFENIGFVLLTKNYPKLSDNLLFFTSFFNKLKWIFAAITLLSFFFILMYNRRK